MQSGPEIVDESRKPEIDEHQAGQPDRFLAALIVKAGGHEIHQETRSDRGGETGDDRREDHETEDSARELTGSGFTVAALAVGHRRNHELRESAEKHDLEQ